MKLVLLLMAALCGLAAGRRYPMSYEYRYRGEIKTGIHELRHQYAGAALEATLKVSVVSSSEAHVQICDPKVGMMHGDVPSSGRAPLPVPNMKPLRDKSALEQSFSVYFSGKQEKLEVPRGEMLWITNLRKSMVSLLRVPFVLSSPMESFVDTQENRIRSDSEYKRSFKKVEDTIHGKCSVRYTLTRAAPIHLMEMMELLEDAERSPRRGSGRDQQGRTQRRSRVDDSDRDAYRLLRSVDHHDCKEHVVLKKSSHGNLTHAGDAQLRGIESRLLVGDYLLSGKPSAEMSMRIERAIVEGVVTFNPFCHETKKIMTISNQTLTLVKTTTTALAPKPSSQLSEETWAFRVESPFRRGPNSPSWVSFQGQDDPLYPIYPEKDLTGFRLTEEMREQLKGQIKMSIRKVSQEIMLPNALHDGPLRGSRDGALTGLMLQVSATVRALMKQDLDELFQELAGKTPQSASSQGSHPAAISNLSDEDLMKRELYITALKTSGSTAAYKVLLEKMKNGQITAIEASGIFVTMKASVESPVIVEDLIEYVMSLDDDTSISLKSAALINLSTLARRLCLSSSDKKYSTQIELMGNYECKREQIVDKYIPYLQNKLKSVSKKYLKAIYIQALANLGDIVSVRTLRHIAEGQMFKKQTNLRLLAIQGLSKHELINTSYPLAEEILLSIAEEQVEKPIIREAALASLFTLPKNANFWQRMAMSTWRESSRRVASFIYTMIKSTASSSDPQYIRQISMAKHVLPLSKPQPRSPYYSSVMLVKGYDLPEDIAGTAEAVHIVDSNSAVPKQFKAKLHAVLGGMHFPVARVSTIGKGLDKLIKEIISKIQGDNKYQSPSTHDLNYRKASEKIDGVSVSDNLDESEDSDEELYLRLTFLKHVDMFMPFTEDSRDQLNDPSKSRLALIINKLKNNEPLRSLTFYNPVEINVMIPSDIGLPIITQMYRPTLFYNRMKANIKLSENDNTIVDVIKDPMVNITGNADTKVVLKRITLMKVLVPWTNKTIMAGVDGESTLGISSKFYVALDRRSPNQKIFQFNVKPNSETESPIVMIKSLPFTAIRDLIGKEDVTEQDMKPVNVLREGPHFRTQIPISKELTGFDAKIDYQGDTQLPINTTTIMECLLKPIKAVTLASSPTVRFYQMSLLFNPARSQTKEITATVSVVTLEDRGPKSGSKINVVQDLTAEDTMETRIQKLRAAGTVTKMYSASLNLSGSEDPRKYEMTLIRFSSGLLPPSTETCVYRKEAKFQMNLMRSRIPSANPNPQEVCICSSFDYPRIQPGAPREAILDENLEFSIESHIFSGEKCIQSNKVFELKAFQRISEERKQHLKRVSSVDPEQPLESTEAIKSTVVYDKFDAEINQKKKMSAKVENITNHVIDAVHGYLFPLITHNHVNINGEKGRVIVNGTRSLANDRYTIWTRTENSICLTQDLRVAALFDYLSPMNSYLNRDVKNSPNLLLEDITSDICQLTPESVKTFAGVRYSKKPVKCDALAVKSDEVQGDRFVIMTKQMSESSDADEEVTVILLKDALTIVIRKDEIIVNDEKLSETQRELKTVSGKTVARVLQTSSLVMIEVIDKLTVELSEGNRIIIQVDDKFRSKVSGLCGRYLQDTAEDLRDSKRCLYRPGDGPLYTAAWIADSKLKQCQQSSSETIKSLIESVKIFQEQCPKSLHEQASKRKPRVL